MIQRNRLYWDDLLQRGIDPTELASRCSIHLEDARHLALPDATLDLLVTSPPYAICYEYKELHQLTQLWLERYGILPPDTCQQAWIGSKGISHRTSSETACSLQTGSALADAALAGLASLAVGEVAQSVHREVRALRYYFQDMHTALHELARVTAPNKHLILVIGDSYRRGITIPTSAALCEMALGSGFELERRIMRKVPARVLVRTRNKKTGRFSSTAQSDMLFSSRTQLRSFGRSQEERPGIPVT